MVMIMIATARRRLAVPRAGSELLFVRERWGILTKVIKKRDGSGPPKESLGKVAGQMLLALVQRSRHTCQRIEVPSTSMHIRLSRQLTIAVARRNT